MCILFVDDEFLITMVAEEALRDAGYQVVTADDAPAAIRLVTDRPEHFICLVTDIHMPGEMTGLDLVEHAHRTYPQLPIVVATGRPDVVTSAWRDQHGALLLPKPYTPKLLVEAVTAVLKEHGP